ncbi:squalene/phytoene synthase family protein [Profundibacterium mesophilum]|uniref:Phytoene synthase n=1 Tax=Profundibacterium mesophilum KAUST100406-0324 TaxID=1037889 RepID=A0A921TEP1_9RHOB|nr:squalene/phytoene synthase family protein [Profundibacterium mesophilum]KAF0677517.1 Phytoene synthase [Profundibacterium mesophilum KAUST100406-0324]
MSVQSCAEAVRRADEDRFLSTMTMPAAARPLLFTLYAFNLEVSRAPIAAREPMIAQMRLQWWRDALGEIAEGDIVRQHETVAPLAAELRAHGLDARDLLPVIDARERDIMPQPFAGLPDLRAYLEATAGTLAVVAGAGLGSGDARPEDLRGAASAGAAARFLCALAPLAAQGVQPLGPDPRDAIVELAQGALSDLEAARRIRFGPATGVLRAFWTAPVLLDQAVRDPDAAIEGRLGLAEFRRRGSLLVKAVAGRW